MFKNTAYKRAIFSLFDSTCKITGSRKYIDDITGATKSEIVVLYDNIPCRMSHEKLGVSNANRPLSIPFITERITVILPSSVKLDEGINSKSNLLFEVTNKDTGRINKYRNSNLPKVYSYHQEIIVNNEDDLS